MRKALASLFAVFAVAFVVGLTMPSADAGPCYYKCICSVSTQVLHQQRCRDL